MSAVNASCSQADTAYGDDLASIGYIFIKLTTLALKAGLLDETDALRAGAAAIFPELEFTQIEVTVLARRRDYVEIERLVASVADQWAIPWKAICAMQRGEPNWQEIVDDSMAECGTTARDLIHAHWRY